jgi:hypothetical protein
MNNLVQFSQTQNMQVSGHNTRKPPLANQLTSGLNNMGVIQMGAGVSDLTFFDNKMIRKGEQRPSL